MNIGDYVEVSVNEDLYVIGKIVTEHSLHSFSWSVPKKAYRIHFLDGSTHTALPDDCRKLTEKEVFTTKLKGNWNSFEV